MICRDHSSELIQWHRSGSSHLHEKMTHFSELILTLVCHILIDEFSHEMKIFSGKALCVLLKNIYLSLSFKNSISDRHPFHQTLLSNLEGFINWDILEHERRVCYMSTFPSTVGMHHRLPFSHPGERFLRNNQEGMSGGGRCWYCGLEQSVSVFIT